MKKETAIHFCVLAALLLSACGQAKKPGSYTVEGTVTDSSANGTTIYITRYDDNRNIDSTIIENNRFVFSGEADTATFCRIQVTRAEYANFILENGDIKVDCIRHNSPSGSPMNGQMTVIAAKVDSIFNAQDRKSGELLAKYGNGREFRDSMSAYFASVQADIHKEMMRLFGEHANDAVGEYLLYSDLMLFSDMAQQEDIFAVMGPWLKSRQTVQKMIKLSENRKNTAEGKPFTDIKGKDADGKEIALSDFIGKGNYVLADFWASWCGPCRAETPNIAKLHEQFKNKGLTVVGLFVWDEQKNLRKATEEENITWPQIIDTGQTAMELYGLSGIPQIILFSPDGTILKRDLRGDNMINIVTEVINKK